MANKITKKMKYEMLLNIEAVKNDEILKEFILKEIEALDKKAERASTNKKSKINDNALQKIELALDEEPKTVEELESELGLGFSNQRYAAYLKKLMGMNETIKKTKKNKKMAYYQEFE